MTCRAGSMLSSSKACKLLPSTPHQGAAVANQGSSGQAETSLVARITVAAAAHVPQVCHIDMLCRLLHRLICSVKEDCFLSLAGFPCSRCNSSGK